ncbi:hypothetical protein SEPCBS57363_002501 [Sporothrix epigloea]|uniref:Ntf2 and rrm domain containing protein n=1 Tax=Sporothrix epigloea TaxID=1892477 RepID=A0ABP0DG96_9PEZI
MATNGTNHNESLSKDEVGWYFVEQYYTTLSKSPSRLHLFYGKTSQLVHDTETEVAAVSVGRQSIQDRIAQLNFQDCKVRISNVDSQASLDNILVQVIGEISNKFEDSRKFVQTFVLAEQKTGYFVLNDIFRYIKEEEEDTTEAVATLATEENKPVDTEEVTAVDASSVKPEEAAQPQIDVALVGQKLEEVGINVPVAPVAAAVASPSEPAVPKTVVPAVPVVTPVAKSITVPDIEKATEEVAEEEEQTKVEIPQEPTPTPVVAPAVAPASVPTAAPAEPEKPKGPPKPMTWASRAAAAAGAARSVALPKQPVAAAPVPASPAVSVPAAAAKPNAAVPANAPAVAPVVAPAVAPAAVPAATPAAVKAADSEAKKESNSEWQTAGVDSKRQNRPQSISGPPQDKDSALGYIKYVTDKVEEAALRSLLETFGPVVYFDISRTKNCAFIEFASPAGYQAAVAANPHTVNGENIVVEPRRPKAGAYGGSNYNPNRGNLSGRGRGGYDGRNGNQGGRGGFSGQNRGRGGAGASRGRGGAQSIAA